MTPRDLAVSKTPEARKWVGAAIDALNHVIGFSGKRSDIEGLPQFKAMKTHFHVVLGPPPPFFLRLLPFVDDPLVTVLKGIRFRYFDMSTALGRASIFLDAPATGEGKKGTAYVPRNRDGTIRITPLYLKVGPLNQLLVLVHEAAHFIGDDVQDYAYRDRTGEPDKRKYIDLPVQFAVLNADSYAYFSLQMATGTNRVLELEE